jgi:hypothetical protein
MSENTAMKAPLPPASTKHIDTVQTQGLVDATQTADKLGKIINYFDTFDGGMDFKTEERKEKDNRRIDQLYREMTRLRKTLEAHVKHRKVMNAEIQDWSKVNLDDYRERFENMLKRRVQTVDERIDVVEGRLTKLEDKFQEMSIVIPDEIEKKSAELTKLLQDFKAEFFAEVKERKKREEEILREMAAFTAETDLNFQEEVEARKKKFEELSEVLAETVSNKKYADDKFEDFTEEEIVKLKDALALECETRENEDDEIVDALNGYTVKLQSSLQIINDADT